jgi:hypothetical protein
MVRGHPAGGTVRVMSKAGIPYACRSKPLKYATSYRDPGIYHYPGYTKGMSKDPMRRGGLRERKRQAGIRKKGSSDRELIFFNFHNKTPTLYIQTGGKKAAPKPVPPSWAGYVPQITRKRKRKRGESSSNPNPGRKPERLSLDDALMLAYTPNIPLKRKRGESSSNPNPEREKPLMLQYTPTYRPNPNISRPNPNISLKRVNLKRKKGESSSNRNPGRKKPLMLTYAP